MKKFLLGLVSGLVLAALCGIIFVFALIRLADRTPTIADNSVLAVRLEGDIPEKPEVEIPLPAFENKTNPTVRDLWSTLKRAAADSRIKAVLVVPRRIGGGWGKTQELHESLVAFRKSGKPVYALLRFAGTRDYYLATAADKIYASPEDLLDVKGLRIESMYFANTLNKLGVSMDVVHAGKYKDAFDAFDAFTRTSMSPETREVLNQMLDQYYSNLTGTIAAGRKKDAATVRALIDKGPFIAKDALADGLVDALGYEDQALGDLRNRLNNSALKTVDSREYIRALTPDISRTKVALVVADGTITQGSGSDGMSASGITSGGFAKLLRRVKSDSTIKAVIVRVDSPGGDAIASDDILHEMKELSKAKPTVISMSDVAASGGYYMSVTGDPIVAYPGTLTGSIGVITAKPNLKGLYDKLGISKDILTRGKFAALDSDYTSLNEQEKAKMGESVDAIYRGFVSRVAAGRKKSYDQIEQIAQGRVWVGTQALERGLVDKLGGLDAALEILRTRAKLPANDKITLVPYPPRRSLLDILMSHSDQALAQAKVEAALARVSGGHWIRAVMDGSPLAVMPYFVTIN